MIRRPPRSTLFSLHDALPILTDAGSCGVGAEEGPRLRRGDAASDRPGRRHISGGDPGRRARWSSVRDGDRKSTRLNSSHSSISYAVFCLKKKKKKKKKTEDKP